MNSALIVVVIYLMGVLTGHSQSPEGPKSYWPKDLDYFPHFSRTVHPTSEGRATWSGLDFRTTIESSLTSCTGNKIVLKQVPYWKATTSFRMPSPEIWITLDEEGDIVSVKVYHSSDDSLYADCLRRLFDRSTVNPGIKSSQPVWCIFNYEIHSNGTN